MIEIRPGYWVTPNGRVFSGRRWLKRSCNGAGYLRVSVPKTEYVHRLVAEAYLDPPEPGQTLVHHKNGNRSDNRVTNLAWVSPEENAKNVSEHSGPYLLIPDFGPPVLSDTLIPGYSWVFSNFSGKFLSSISKGPPKKTYIGRGGQT